MSRTDKDRPYWVISNDPWAKNSILEHRCGTTTPLYGGIRECSLGTPREPGDFYFDNCGNLDPRELFWYEGYESDTTRLRARKRYHTHSAMLEANTALRAGEFYEFSEDYDYPDGDSRYYDYIW